MSMFDSFINLVVGDLEEKRAYKHMMKKVDALPEDYSFTFRKIQHYMFNVGAFNGDEALFKDMKIFEGLIDLFESSAAEGKQVLEVTGPDVAQFADDLMQASSDSAKEKRAHINQEIMDRFTKEQEQS